jgi:uncharacterized protein
MRKLRGLCIPFILLLLALACTGGPCITIVAPDGKALASVSVEIADNSHKRELGLMYRDHLDPESGMIFVFPAPDQQAFWMKNTHIPLDMIFADKDGRVLGTVTNAVPYSEKSVGVQGLSLYVLEVNGGFAAKHSIVVGDRLEFTGFDPHTLQ